MSGFWDVSFSDYISWGLGITAIIIALSIFLRQETVNKKIEAMKKSATSLSVGRIITSFERIKGIINANMEFTELFPDMDGERKVVIARKFMADYMKQYCQFVDNIVKENNFLKDKINLIIYTQTEDTIQYIKNYQADELRDAEWGALEALRRWHEFSKNTIQKIDEVLLALEKLQNEELMNN